MASETHPAARISVRVTNTYGHGVPFVLEPWGEIYDMPASASFDVVAEGPESGPLEILSTEKQITVYGWAGSTVALYHDGEELGPGQLKRPRVPTLD